MGMSCPIPSMGRTVYLPTWMVDFSGFHVGKYIPYHPLDAMGPMGVKYHKIHPPRWSSTMVTWWPYPLSPGGGRHGDGRRLVRRISNPKGVCGLRRPTHLQCWPQATGHGTGGKKWQPGVAAMSWIRHTNSEPKCQSTTTKMSLRNKLRGFVFGYLGTLLVK